MGRLSLPANSRIDRLKPDPRHAGVALWEWLVCLFIILLLAAVLFPVLNRGVDSESRGACQSNMKQIALAMRMYAKDSGTFPPALSDGKGALSAGNWAGMLRPYSRKNSLHFQCPHDKGVRSPNKVSYGFNARLGGQTPRDLAAPARIIMNYEVVTDDWARVGNNPLAATASARHLDGSNYAFVDGHVKWLELEKVTVLPPSKSEYTFAPG